MEVRKINAQDDFTAIGNIYASSWKAAYKGIVPQEHLDSLKGDGWAVFLADPQHDGFVIMDGEIYAGTSSIWPARDSKMEGWGEIGSIYLLPEYFGAGYGAPLFKHSEKALVDQGFQKIYIWVLADNHRAQRFYEKHGFYHNGDVTPITIGGKDLEEYRFIKHIE